QQHPVCLEDTRRVRACALLNSVLEAGKLNIRLSARILKAPKLRLSIRSGALWHFQTRRFVAKNRPDGDTIRCGNALHDLALCLGDHLCQPYAASPKLL